MRPSWPPTCSWWGKGPCQCPAYSAGQAAVAIVSRGIGRSSTLPAYLICNRPEPASSAGGQISSSHSLGVYSWLHFDSSSRRPRSAALVEPSAQRCLISAVSSPPSQPRLSRPATRQIYRPQREARQQLPDESPLEHTCGEGAGWPPSGANARLPLLRIVTTLLLMQGIRGPLRGPSDQARDQARSSR